MDRTDQWTVRLASVLSNEINKDQRRIALADLALSYVTGQSAIDQTRLRILDLIRQLDRLVSPAPPTRRPRLAVASAGIALVAVDIDLAPLPTEAILNWLTAPLADIVLIDAHSSPPLAERLRHADITDSRLTLIRLDAPVTWTQAFNIGFRIARNDRIWAVGAETRLSTPAHSPVVLLPGRFAALHAGAGAFLLDAYRADLTSAGGFNEYFDTSDGAVADLAKRLSVQGRQAFMPQPTLLANDPHPKKTVRANNSGTLRDYLLQSLDFAERYNLAIAAAMPDWTDDSKQIPFDIHDSDDLGQHIKPLMPLTAAVPTQVRADARMQVLHDLMRDRFGGQPDRTAHKNLDLLLDRPISDVSAVDFAVAASSLPALVGTREAWLVVQMDASCLPYPDSPAAQGFAILLAMAATHRQTPVLCVDDDVTAAQLSHLTPCVVVPGAVDISAIWPTELREIARPLGRSPRHATLPFNRQTLADLQQLGLSGPTILNRRPKIFIDAQHGLGNRMRAIASAAAIATGTDRELVIIWAPDDHCACIYEDLFFPHGAVLSEGFATEAESLGLTLFNYMEIEPGAVKNAPITMGAFQDVYIRSAFPLISPCSNWHSENVAIRNLQPNEVVRALVTSVRNPNDLSIHIRMEGGQSAQHLPYESAANWTAEAHQHIDESRKRSHFKYFLPRLDELIAQGLAERVFLATDTPSVYNDLQSRYGNRVTWLNRKVSDRSAQAIVYALADAILLSRAPRLLGSTWSSFSELAARLSDAPMTVELTGRDF